MFPEKSQAETFIRKAAILGLKERRVGGMLDLKERGFFPWGTQASTRQPANGSARSRVTVAPTRT